MVKRSTKKLPERIQKKIYKQSQENVQGEMDKSCVKMEESWRDLHPAVDDEWVQIMMMTAKLPGIARENIIPHYKNHLRRNIKVALNKFGCSKLKTVNVYSE